MFGPRIHREHTFCIHLIYLRFELYKTLPCVSGLEEERARYSCCPVEGGTVMTNAGTVSMGTVLAGVSASLAPETVPLAELMSAHLPPVHSAASINSVWATTLAGTVISNKHY